MGRIRTETPGTPAEEFILGKEDIAHIFTLNQAAWEAYSRKLEMPSNWKGSLRWHATGTEIVALDKGTGAMMSICPTYADGQNPPVRLTITTGHPHGHSQGQSEQMVRNLKLAVQGEIGEGYGVSVACTSAPTTEIIEVSVMKRA